MNRAVYQHHCHATDWLLLSRPPPILLVHTAYRLLLRHLHRSGQPELAGPPCRRLRGQHRAHHLIVHTQFHTQLFHRQQRRVLRDPVTLFLQGASYLFLKFVDSAKLSIVMCCDIHDDVCDRVLVTTLW